MAYPLDKRTFSYGDLKVSGVTLLYASEDVEVAISLP